MRAKPQQSVIRSRLVRAWCLCAFSAGHYKTLLIYRCRAFGAFGERVISGICRNRRLRFLDSNSTIQTTSVSDFKRSKITRNHSTNRANVKMKYYFYFPPSGWELEEICEYSFSAISFCTICSSVWRRRMSCGVLSVPMSISGASGKLL